ncbi:MAG: right-handed parallel beta-helix repeat-containing protein [Terriglobia bacterium]|jgi:hypothetical protein
MIAHDENGTRRRRCAATTSPGGLRASACLATLALLSLLTAPRATNGRPRSDGRTISIKPGDNLAAIVDREPRETTFVLKAGVYSIQPIRPKDGDSFQGEAGAVLSGAQILREFWRSGQLWVAQTGAALSDSHPGKCDDKHPDCQYPEDLFIDDSPLERVDSLEAVGPGKWYLDYSADRAYLAENPEGHRVEMSVVPHAFWGPAQNVKIVGLTIEKFTCPAQDGAVDGRAGSNWLIENNLIRLNHGIGIRLGDGMQVLRNKLLRNGQLGIGGGGSNGIVDGNEIAFNNFAGYDYGWEAGGSKFAFTKNLVVRNNYAHDNKGPGLWTDIENENTLYENNHTKSNQEAGILHEISYRAIIRNNLIEDDGFSDSGKTEPWYGAGIIIAGSSSVEVYGNTVTGCMNGIIGTQPHREPSRRGTPYLLRDLYVHDNTITQNQGIAAGIVRSAAFGDAVFDSWNNRFTNNQFHLADPQAKSFAWGGSALSYQDWTLALNRH